MKLTRVNYVAIVNYAGLLTFCSCDINIEKNYPKMDFWEQLVSRLIDGRQIIKHLQLVERKQSYIMNIDKCLQPKH